MPMPQAQQARPVSPLKQFNDAITGERTQDYLRKVLGQNAQAFTTSLVSIVTNNAQLQQCDPYSVMYCALKGATLNLQLDPNFGFAYIIPYKDNRAGRTFAQFQMGYKGLLQLAMRSGQFSRINTGALREGELVSSNLLTGDLVINSVQDREKKPVIGYFAYMRLMNGFEKTLYMTKDAVEAHAKRYSQSYKYDRNKTSVWAQNFDLMAEKTVLKLLLSRYAPLSLEMQQAIQDDQKVFDQEGEGRYTDNDTSSVLSQMAQAAMEAEAVEVKDEQELEPVQEEASPDVMEDAPARKAGRTTRNGKEVSDGLPFDD